MEDILTVRKLKNALADLPDDTPVGLSVYNHTWYANCHTLTHGPAHVALGEFHSGEKIAVIYVGDDGWPKDGYLDKKKKSCSVCGFTFCTLQNNV